MSALLENEYNRNITTVSELKDGQIAVIVNASSYEGAIVQRYGDNCVKIGRPSGEGWSNCKNNSLTVRILEDDELIKIFDNK